MFRELKFAEVTRIEPWEHLLDESYAFSGCTEAAKAYTENLMRMHALTSVPGYSFMSGSAWHEAGTQILNATPNLNGDALSERTRMAFWAINRLYTDEEKTEQFRESTWNADCICSLVSPVYEGFKAALQSIVIQAWTAFEVLWDDLWHKVAEIRPDLFSAMSQGEKDDLGFRSRKRARKAYQSLFKKDSAEIVAAMTPTVIDALAVMRNLLVHSAGRIGSGF